VSAPLPLLRDLQFKSIYADFVLGTIGSAVRSVFLLSENADKLPQCFIGTVFRQIGYCQLYIAALLINCPLAESIRINSCQNRLFWGKIVWFGQ